MHASFPFTPCCCRIFVIGLPFGSAVIVLLGIGCSYLLVMSCRFHLIFVIFELEPGRDDSVLGYRGKFVFRCRG